MDAGIPATVPYISNTAGHQVVIAHTNPDRRRSNIRLALVLGIVALLFMGGYLYYWTR